jgi:elongation of very long chain fatty acids protein 1
VHLGPVIDSLPLMASPLPLTAIIIAYMWFVLKAGPDLMKSRKAYDLTQIIRVYNIFQVVICAWFVYKVHQLNFSFNMTWRCIDTLKPGTELKVYIIMWRFILLRGFEFIETIFFVLRKKQNQVSTLHVYHHISTVVLLWIFFKYSPGYTGSFTAIFNSCIHIVMYFYYFLTSFKSMLKLTTKIKPFMTAIQIAQLIIILGHLIVAVMPSCETSKIYYLMIINISILILMFGQFYFKSYMKKKVKRA